MQTVSMITMMRDEHANDGDDSKIKPADSSKSLGGNRKDDSKKVGVTISIVIAGGLATKREGSSFKSVMSRIIHVEEVATATTQTTPTTSDQHCTSTSASASSYNPQLKHRHG